MATTDQQLLDSAREALLRILDGDTAEWQGPDGHRQRLLEINRLTDLIAKYEIKVAASSRRVLRPIRTINV